MPIDPALTEGKEKFDVTLDTRTGKHELIVWGATAVDALVELFSGIAIEQDRHGVAGIGFKAPLTVEVRPARPGHCPSCGSSSANRFPATAHEGEALGCPDEWHLTDPVHPPNDEMRSLVERARARG